MTSLVNPYFPKNSPTEQNLVDNLVSESIKIMGHTFYYIPRNIVSEDLILGEDILSHFTIAIPIEMYMQNTTGFEGQKEIFSKFGLQIQNSFTLVVSKARWEQEVKKYFDGSGEHPPFELKTYLRPQEGDLIWDPLTTSLYETKFCDHDSEFYQIGKNYRYHLSCEIFQYAHEKIQTGIPEIDTLTDLMSLDLLRDQLMTEDGDFLVMEECNKDYILQDVVKAPDSRDRKWGVDFDPEANAEGVVIIDPFAE